MNRENEIKSAINTRLSELIISKELENKILNGCSNKRRTIGRPLTIAAAICLCLLISVPVVAANTGTFEKLLKLVSQQTAMKLQPIELVSESNGIKMEVVAAMNDDETAVVYLTLQDVAGKGRVDKTVDLYNYFIEGADSFTHELVNYDDKTQTATIRMLASGGKKLNGKKVMVSLDSFLSGKESFNKIDTGIVIKDIVDKSSEAIPLDMNNIPGGSGALFDELKQTGIINVLKTDETNIKITGIDFTKISNIGYVDGRLHIQTKWSKSIDDHGFIYLANSDGDQINPSNIYFGTDEKGRTKYGRDYIEYIFDMNAEQVSGYSLQGDFVKNNNYTEGKWQTTFKIQAVDGATKEVKNIDVGNTRIDKITVSAMGVNIFGRIQASKDLSINVTMKDGKTLFCDNSLSESSNGEAVTKYIPDGPIDVGNIKEVRINNELINFN